MAETAENQIDPLEMSDEDIAKLDLSQIAATDPDDSEEPEEGNPDDESTEEDESDESEEEAGTEEEPESADDDDAEPESTEPRQVFEDSGSAEDTADEQEVKETSDNVNYQEEYEKLLTPFKANGREMKVDNVDEARQLMQMGANYNKKMAALKPSFRIIKTLENNELLDEEKVNFLVDLVSKKKPEAISKFMTDAGVDPYDLNLEENTEYKPESHLVSEKEMELDDVLREIQTTEHYERTMNEITGKWDQASKRVLLDNPQLISAINEHVGSGIYDQIMATVEKERILGRLVGMSDLEAYKAIGDAIQARGGFAQPNEPTPKRTASQDPKTKSRKRAAAPTKGKPSKTGGPAVNPLALSDEEFEKINSKFI
jgi:hypothetical protein